MWIFLSCGRLLDSGLVSRFPTIPCGNHAQRSEVVSGSCCLIRVWWIHLVLVTVSSHVSSGPLQGLGVLSSSDRSALKRRIKDVQTAAEKERKALEKLEKQKEKQRRRDQEQRRN